MMGENEKLLLIVSMIENELDITHNIIPPLDIRLGRCLHEVCETKFKLEKEIGSLLNKLNQQKVNK
jgi:hypothetical protein